ncbi:MAG: hypothetical protein DHS20C15_01210 [Planctomycetota bacterium]|nr:MAG: hypothetical protein DHS20C15_01210 [Planctomycetota bacterium]
MNNYTPYQQGIIKRFYENRDTIAIQKLAEVVSDLYVATTEKKIDAGWKRVYSNLITAGVHKHHAQSIVDDRDLGALARMVSELT